MLYTVQHISAITLTEPATRPGFSPSGVENYRFPVLGVGGLHIPLDTPVEAYAPHAAWLIAREMSGALSRVGARVLGDLEPDAPAATIAEAIRMARYGDPFKGLWVIVPEDVTRARVLVDGHVYEAAENTALEEQAAELARSLKADPDAVAAARREYAQCLAQAIKDPDVMSALFADGADWRLVLQKAFADAPYVEQARAHIARLVREGGKR